ncbi:MAG: hydroxyacid dehydrogenase [Clostridia bacterium]|nr:hydroxyacid dehydrogenase [Clostridia bacterium]
MKIVILDAGTLGADVDLSPLHDLGEVVSYENTPTEQIRHRLQGADVCVVNKLKLNESNLHGTGLRLICEAATGYDNIDLAYCREVGIAVCNVPGYSTHSVAQLTLAMALSLANHLPVYREFVHSGAYSNQAVANRLVPVWHELAGQTWGIVGAGNIGSRVAHLAESLGCKVIVCRRKQDPRYETVDLDTLCQRADIISVHLPLSQETRGIIDARRIDLMKPGALFINVARGAVVDEEALTRAVESGRLGGIGIDVFSVEPLPSDHPYHRILDRDNVCLTPHTAWGSYEARCRCVREMAENARSFFAGETRNRVETGSSR